MLGERGVDRRGPARQAGFSLTELMIVCALAAILLGYTVPVYRQYLLRAHRSAAIEKLLAAAACQERIYSLELAYDTSRCQPATDVHYELHYEATGSVEIPGYVVIAEPLANQQDDPCGRLLLAHTGQRETSGPAERSRQCWEGR